MTFSNRDTHTNPLFSQLGLIKLKDLVTIHTAFFCFNIIIIYNLLPKAFDNFFLRISSKHNFNTRLVSKSTYYIDHVRTNYGKFNYLYLVP